MVVIFCLTLCSVTYIYQKFLLVVYQGLLFVMNLGDPSYDKLGQVDLWQVQNMGQVVLGRDFCRANCLWGELS